MELADKTAIVTAAGTGIGAGVAAVFAREGANLALVDADAHAAEVVAQNIIDNGGTAIAVGSDLWKKDEVEAVVVETLRKFGAIDILVNATCFQPPPAAMQCVTENQWDAALEAGPKSIFLCSQAVIPAMVSQNRGRVVNIVPTVAATAGFAPGLLYAVAKHAIIALTHQLAREFAPNNISANAVCPGTLAAADSQDEVVSARHANLPKRSPSLTRFCTVDHVAQVALFLASGRSEMITGQVFYVDGGIRGGIYENLPLPARRRIERETVGVHD